MRGDKGVRKCTDEPLSGGQWAIPTGHHHREMTDGRDHPTEKEQKWVGEMKTQKGMRAI